MKKKTELEFKQDVKANLRDNGYLPLGIENGPGGDTGIPDLVVIGKGTFFWVELKVVDELPEVEYGEPVGYSLGLRATQVLTIRDLVDHGAQVYMMIAKTDGTDILVVEMMHYDGVLRAAPHGLEDLKKVFS